MSRPTTALATPRDAAIFRRILYTDPVTLKCKCPGCKGEIIVWEALTLAQKTEVIRRASRGATDRMC